MAGPSPTEHPFSNFEARATLGGWSLVYPAVLTAILAILVVVGLGITGVIPGFHLGPAGPPSPAARYTIAFTESGLPLGTVWMVTLAGSPEQGTGASIDFVELSGNYAYSVGAFAGYLPNPSNGTVSVVGQPVTVSISFSPTHPAALYSVDFGETGLPAGTNWSLTLNGSTQFSTGVSISFKEPNGTYSYTVGSIPDYLASPTSGTLQVDGKTVSVVVGFEALGPPKFAIAFTETGLPIGTGWSVVLNGTSGTSTTTTIVFRVPNGSYDYSVADVGAYVPLPTEGSVAVLGTNVTVPVSFSNVSAPAPDLSAVTFDEVGVPVNTTWGVWLNALSLEGEPSFSQASAGASQTLYLPNGTYNWTGGLSSDLPVGPPGARVIANPVEGEFNVTGAPLTETLEFEFILPTATNYSVTLNESGLPAGWSWFVVLNGSNQSAATGAAIAFSEPNGTFFFEAGTNAPGFTGDTQYGYLAVVGMPVDQAVAFSVDYTLDFNESGLQGVDQWVVTVTGPGVNQYLGAIGQGSTFLTVPNGTYNFTVVALQYSVTPSFGFVTIFGSSVTVYLVFTRLPCYLLTLNEVGLPDGDPWAVSVTGSVDNISVGNLTDAHTVSQSFSLPNGTYLWAAYAFIPGYFVEPDSGVLEVDGANVSTELVFTPVSMYDHAVLFAITNSPYPSVSGLPPGTTWSVTINGTTVSSTGSLIALYLPNGSYGYTLTGPAGYDLLPSVGNLTVNSSEPPFERYWAAQVDAALVSAPELAPTHPQISILSGANWGPGVEPPLPHPAMASSVRTESLVSRERCAPHTSE